MGISFCAYWCLCSDTFTLVIPILNVNNLFSCFSLHVISIFQIKDFKTKVPVILLTNGCTCFHRLFKIGCLQVHFEYTFKYTQYPRHVYLQYLSISLSDIKLTKNRQPIFKNRWKQVQPLWRKCTSLITQRSVDPLQYRRLTSNFKCFKTFQAIPQTNINIEIAQGERLIDLLKWNQCWVVKNNNKLYCLQIDWISGKTLESQLRRFPYMFCFT